MNIDILPISFVRGRVSIVVKLVSAFDDNIQFYVVGVFDIYNSCVDWINKYLDDCEYKMIEVYYDKLFCLYLVSVSVIDKELQEIESNFSLSNFKKISVYSCNNIKCYSSLK